MMTILTIALCILCIPVVLWVGQMFIGLIVIICACGPVVRWWAGFIGVILAITLIGQM